jgi:hypothetical protein
VSGRDELAFFHRLAHRVAFVVDVAVAIEAAATDEGLEPPLALAGQVLAVEPGQGRATAAPGLPINLKTAFGATSTNE